MYAAVRRYKFDSKSGTEIAQKIQDGFIPILRKTPGFVAYYWLETATGEGASLSVFDSAAGAEESIRVAADFVQKNLAALLGKPEVIQGEVKAHS
jgi:hypothetical protein